MSYIWKSLWNFLKPWKITWQFLANYFSVPCMNNLYLQVHSFSPPFDRPPFHSIYLHCHSFQVYSYVNASNLSKSVVLPALNKTNSSFMLSSLCLKLPCTDENPAMSYWSVILILNVLCVYVVWTQKYMPISRMYQGLRHFQGIFICITSAISSSWPFWPWKKYSFFIVIFFATSSK